MVKFSDEDKKQSKFSDSNWLPFGVSKVKIGMIELGGTEDDEKEYVEVTVFGDNSEEDSARVWFTTPAAINYSINTLRDIYVHNAPQDKKQAARDTIDEVADSAELVEKLNERLIGGECWFTKYYDETRTYTNQAGDTKRSVNKNIYGYEPKLKPQLMPKSDEAEVTNQDLENVSKVMPGAKNEPSDGIPNKW